MEVDGHMTWEPIISLSNELHARSRIRVGYSAQATVAIDGFHRGENITLESKIPNVYHVRELTVNARRCH